MEVVVLVKLHQRLVLALLATLRYKAGHFWAQPPLNNSCQIRTHYVPKLLCNAQSIFANDQIFQTHTDARRCILPLSWSFMPRNCQPTTWGWKISCKLCHLLSTRYWIRCFDLFAFYQSLALNSKIWEELTVQPSWGTKWPFDQHPSHHNFLQIVYKVERHLPHICTTSALWSWGMHPLLKKEQKIYIFVKSSRPHILHICPWHLSIKMIR